jgi:hypothetical protein
MRTEHSPGNQTVQTGSQRLVSHSSQPLPEFAISSVAEFPKLPGGFQRGDPAIAHIPSLLAWECADALYSHLKECKLWGLKLSNGDRVLGIGPRRYETLSAKDAKALADTAYAAARQGYSFIREEAWLPPLDLEGLEAAPIMISLVKFLRSAPFGRLVSEVTGQPPLELVRFRVERYRAGHFCGFSEVPRSVDQIGFSISFARSWIVDWGGLLQFRDSFGSVDRAYLPTWNTCTLYSLSRSHGVSFVAPFAHDSAYFVTGQLAEA